MSIKNIFYPKIIQEKELLFPNELSNNIDETLLDKIKHKLGNRCSKEGYIEKDTIEILERSLGMLDTSHFSGNIVYDIKLKVNTCNPLEGDVLDCTIMGKNKIGIICKKGPLLIALSKIHHEDNLDIFDSLDKHDKIKVEVICSKYELNDTEIRVIAKLKN
mgnify:CR=1 FL=1